jgi:rare lipoprotein A
MGLYQDKHLFPILLLALLCVASRPSAASAQSSHSVRPGATLTGKATYYPNSLNGHETASGTTFHQGDHTAATNKLPLGSKARVTNLRTGKRTEVTFTDHGRDLGSRKVDLSKRAAKDIGLTHHEGVASVKIKVISTPPRQGAAPPAN